MIEEKTVFIIGAGASQPYGYPIGKKLRKIICNNILKLLIKYVINKNKTPFPEYDAPSIKREYESFSKIFFRSSTHSIDLFLSRNNSFLDIGKLSIISVLLEAEASSKFREEIEEEHDWYTHLYEKMTNTLTSSGSYKDFKNNNISFITFNYDRSLEYFLYESITNSFHDNNIDHNIRTSKINYKDIIPFPFIHVYGKLHLLPWQDNDSLEYRIRPNYSIYKIKDNIRVIHERINSDIENAKKLIQGAERIFFLGFAFADENLEVLCIPEILKFDQKIYGTAYNYTDREISDIRNKFSRNEEFKKMILEKSNNPIIKDCDCLSLLKNYL